MPPPITATSKLVPDTLLCSLPCNQRRGVFQIFNGTVLGAALILQIASGFVKTNVFWLAMLAMPGTLIGARLGMRTYQALNDRNFYDVVLALLFLSGLGLVWSSIAPR